MQYHQGKCTRQPIGRHNVGETPQIIASYLGLPNANRYTGHCFRRTAATLLSESGASMQQIKQLGRWRSDMIAQGYIEDSIRNKQQIFDGIIHKSKENITPNSARPSTSAQNITPDFQISSTSAQNITNCESEQSLT